MNLTMECGIVTGKRGEFIKAVGRLLVYLVLGSQAVSPAQAQAPMTIRVALSEAMPPGSFIEDGQASGMLKDLLRALFTSVSGYRPEFHAFPWTRAQRLVEGGQMDMFVTFPSENRKRYAAFSPHAIYTLDYGNIVYDRTAASAARIEAASSFEDLRGLVFVSQESVYWEDENVPSHFRRYVVNNPLSLMHMTFQRKAGDFFIMPVEQAIYYARTLGYQAHLGMKRVGFIPNSTVEFHVGVRKSLPRHQALLAALDKAALSPEFQAKRKVIERRYRELATAGKLPKPPGAPPT